MLLSSATEELAAEAGQVVGALLKIRLEMLLK